MCRVGAKDFFSAANGMKISWKNTVNSLEENGK